MIELPETIPERESFYLGDNELPRVFNGLWQLSSNSWGSSPAAKIRRDMTIYAENGFTAFDMADHYGPAEILFGEFRKEWSELHERVKIFGATKWCVFRKVEATRALVETAVNERLERMQSQRVDLLQFHWQDYNDRGYLTVLHQLNDLRGGKIALLGLCNFDTVRMEEICTELGPGAIVSNQVQFSLIDLRPLYGMNEACKKHNVKLLTYGSLCGGFLSDEWLGKEEPDLYTGFLTPSQRKYLDMIVTAWGTWSLFQNLLTVLRGIADKYGRMSIANVATRWVLDHDFVGAVLIGVRMGVSQHADDNQRVYTFRLDAEDRHEIDTVLQQSNGPRLIRTIGDCGAEYR